MLILSVAGRERPRAASTWGALVEAAPGRWKTLFLYKGPSGGFHVDGEGMEPGMNQLIRGHGSPLGQHLTWMDPEATSGRNTTYCDHGIDPMTGFTYSKEI